MQDYVEQRDGGYYLAGTRISLDSVVLPFLDGTSPERILGSFPMIGSLERVYGALTFYLANQEAVNAYLAEQDRLIEAAGQAHPLPEHLRAKLLGTARSH